MGRYKSLIIGLLVLTAVAVLFEVGTGSTYRITLAQVLTEISRGPQDSSHPDNWVVWQLRLPRACYSILVGGILSIVGASFQALFRNPLAEPYTVGVASGAALGGVLVLLLGASGMLFGLALPIGGFIGGYAALLLVLALSRRKAVVIAENLLLAGVLIGGLLAACLSLALLAAGQDTNQVLRWLLGSFSPAFWNRCILLAVALVVGGYLIYRQGRALNAVAVGIPTAKSLGVDVKRTTQSILFVGTAMVAIAVGTVGVIGFLGLVAPHIARRLVGTDWRLVLPVATLVGMILMSLSDLISQRAIAMTELPVGAVTAVLGAPLLLLLLRKNATA